MRRSCLKPYMRRRFNFVTAVSLGSFLGLFSVLLGLLKIQNVPPRNHTLSPPPDPCHLSGRRHLTYSLNYIFPSIPALLWKQQQKKNLTEISLYSDLEPQTSTKHCRGYLFPIICGFYYSSLNTHFGQIFKGQC